MTKFELGRILGKDDGIFSFDLETLIATRVLYEGNSGSGKSYAIRRLCEVTNGKVHLFLESLMDAPRELWHPALIIIDEAHVFSPEDGSAESEEAVIALATQGRKRGFGAVLATQRISQLSKAALRETEGLRAGAMKMLKAIAQFNELGRHCSREQIGTFAGFSPKGGTFSTYINELKKNSLVIEERGVGVRASPALFLEEE